MRYFVNKLLTLCNYKRDCFQSLIDMNKLIKLPFYVLDINRTVDRYCNQTLVTMILKNVMPVFLEIPVVH